MIYIKDVEELKKHIMEKGYNYSSFSRELGVSRSYLIKVLQRGKISYKNAQKILSFFNKKFDDFFFVE